MLGFLSTYEGAQGLPLGLFSGIIFGKTWCTLLYIQIELGSVIYNASTLPLSLSDPRAVFSLWILSTHVL